MIHHISTQWLLLGATAPLLLALLVALPFWLKRVEDMGSVLGAGVILAAAVGLIAREYAEILQHTEACIAANVGCRFRPLPFTRYGIYASISMVQIFLVFAIGLWVEERIRQRRVAPEWRR